MKREIYSILWKTLFSIFQLPPHPDIDIATTCIFRNLQCFKPRFNLGFKAKVKVSIIDTLISAP